ncbi:class II myosin [Malassezia sp. CBS 17886]|nr:class II myosin [Malassezia sp. CBS 17886]
MSNAKVQLNGDPDRRDVWVPDREYGFVSGYVVSEAGGNSTCGLASGQVATLPTSSLSEMNPPKFDKADDIADLTFLNEASVVHNLRQRYFSNLIYTYSGLFLVAVNPYHALPIYSDATIEMYRDKRREANPPHIFAVADGAIRNMLNNQENHSLLITGESGAGKTENTKRVIQYLAAVAADVDSAAVPTRRLSSEPLGLLERQILQANPILEAFGNAQTVRNNNSSRFGKFIRIEFSATGVIAGGNIEWYLLEKSRVHSRGANERNFHVFYQLLRSRDKDLLAALQLSGYPEHYHYLRASRKDVEGVDDSVGWTHLLEALRTMGFSAAEEQDIFRVIAVILHFGNVELAEDRSEQARIKNPEQLERVSGLIGVDAAKLTNALLRPTVRAGREIMTQARNKKQVTDEIAALCKTMYEKTFGWLVERINHVLDRPTSKSRFIGVLDIAGFEIFETNSFEQLCINYTNEKLQQFFNHHMFMLEQEEYARESIPWDFVNFGLDLQPTIDLIESASPVGILSCLDEECIMPKATDVTFTEKLTATWQTRPQSNEAETAKFVASRQARRFVVRHYAAGVEYNTEQWLDKNRDPLNDNLARVLSGATEGFISSLFADLVVDDSAPRMGRRGAFRTVGQRHKEQLASLMAQLDATQPHFVRCIVPNNEKKPGKMDLPMVLEQLRCNGVLEGIRIARLGYPNRLLFSEFCNRYGLLAPAAFQSGNLDGRVVSRHIADELGIDTAVYKIGMTKIFFKAGVLAEMEEHRDACLHDLFSRFGAACRRRSAQRVAQKRLRRRVATAALRQAASAYAGLQKAPWWGLYMRLLPLLTATQNDDETRRRELEVALAQERTQRDARERESLAALESRLRKEMNVLHTELLDERAQHAESREHAARMQAHLADTESATRALNADVARLGGAHHSVEQQHAELQEAHSALLKEVGDLQAQTVDASRRETELEADMRATSAHLDALVGERTELDREKEEMLASIARLQEQLSHAQAELHAHHEAAESHIRELGARHETELQNVRAALGTAEEGGAHHRTRVSELESHVQRLTEELADAERTHADATARAQRHETDLATESERANALSDARRAAEEALAATQAKHAELTEHAAQAEVLHTDVTQARDALQAEKATHTQTAAALAAERDAAQASVAELRGRDDRHREERSALEARLQAGDEKVAALMGELATKSAELRNAQASVRELETEMKRLENSQNKTTVEHVHVLEEAKKYTDRQLTDVQAELQELTKYTRSLEKTRARLQLDNEQLTRLASEAGKREKENAGVVSPDEAMAQRDQARAELRRSSQAAALTLRQTRAEYEDRLSRLEEELRRAQRERQTATQRTSPDRRADRRMSSAARKVLEELRVENERLEKDLAAKASALRTKHA